MGLANASLNSWNAWDRQRMGWYGATDGVDNAYLVSARDANNTAEVNGDLDASLPGGAGIYTLRDFVGTGDAIRIKLPFTNPSTEYPEFLWVENHQGRALNGNPFDKWQYEGADCVDGIVPGLQMYVQIDKEVREASSSAPIYSGPGDHLRPLDASGHYDESFSTATVLNTCICWQCPLQPFVRGLANPFTGTADRHWVPVDLNADIHISTTADSRANSVEDVSGVSQIHAYDLGNARQVFTPGGNQKLGIGTNPSSATMMNLVGYQFTTNNQPNLRRIYLNGVSVELLAQNADGSIQVRVRFDDVDVTNDARWCADEIQLNPVATSTGYSLNITNGNTLTLDRGTTPTQRDATPELYNGQQVFNMPTLMRCTNGTVLNMEGGSQLVVDHGSTLRLEAGSWLQMAGGSNLHVRNGGRLEIMPGAILKLANGAHVHIEEGPDASMDGRLIYHPGAIIRLDGTTSELAFAGILEIKDNASFQVVSNVSSLYTKGLIRFNSTRPISQNVVAGANSRFIVRSNSLFQRVLLVDQESLYGPAQLVEFSLISVSAVLNSNARIVPPVTNACAIKVINARVTSPGAPNNHRGYRLNGQQQVTLQGSRFERGSYGMYAFNPTLGNTPHVNDCEFADCGIGFYSMGKAVSVNASLFKTCKAGLLAEQVSQTSKIIQSAANGNQTGIFVQGAASLLILDPEFDENVRGLVLEGMDTRIECGSISDNTLLGIHLKYSGTLRLDGTLDQEHEPLSALNNPTTIKLLQANNCFLNLGNNSLRPAQTGIGKTLNGTFICGPYQVQAAYRNNWEGTPYSPLTTAEYAIFTNCAIPAPVVFDDPFGADETPCGQALLTCPNPPCLSDPELDALVLCPSCREVETEELGVVDLNVASLEAKLLGEDDDIPQNEVAAVELHAQILMNDLEAPSADEAYLVGFNYCALKESYSDALNKGQLIADPNDPMTNELVDMITEVQDKRMDEAEQGDYYELKLFSAIDKAQTLRATGKYADAIAVFDDILLWVGTEEQDMVSRLACLTVLERDVAEGAVYWDDAELMMEQCAPNPYKSRHATADEPAATGGKSQCPGGVGIQNKVSSLSLVGFSEEHTQANVLDVAGRLVWSGTLTGDVQVFSQSLPSGPYSFVLEGDRGSRCAGRFAVLR